LFLGNGLKSNAYNRPGKRLRSKIREKPQKINMDSPIQTAREIGKAIGSIPIGGYILFGEDKS